VTRGDIGVERLNPMPSVGDTHSCDRAAQCRQPTICRPPELEVEVSSRRNGAAHRGIDANLDLLRCRGH
jgi:hypothetical protein